MRIIPDKVLEDRNGRWRYTKRKPQTVAHVERRAARRLGSSRRTHNKKILVALADHAQLELVNLLEEL